MPSPPSVIRITLIGLVSLAIAMGVGRFAFTPLLPLMQDDGLATVTDGGVLASLHFLGYWLGAVFAARIPGSPKTALRISLIAIGFATLGMGMTESFVLWLVFRWVCGVCSAFILVLVSSYYVRYLTDAGQSGKHGWVFSGVGAGIVVAGLGALAIMVGQISSLASWQIFGAASLIVALMACVMMDPEIPDGRPPAVERASQRTPLVWSVVIAYGAAGIGYIIPATYLPVMAREIVHSPIIFGWSWPVFGLAAFLSTLLAARLQVRFSNRQIWVVGQIVMAVGLLLPVAYSHIAGIIIGGICVGGTFMIITMVGMKEMHRLVPAGDVMRHIAVMTASFATGQMIGPVFAGSIYDLTGGFSASLVITSAILIVTVIPMLASASKPEVFRTTSY